MTDEAILKLADENQARAKEVLLKSGVIEAWESIGAQVNLVGSVKTGLLMKKLDIDIHVYTETLDVAKSFEAAARFASSGNVLQVEFGNLADTEECCFEWHAKYRDSRGDMWKFDMIHILKGSHYDGVFERIAERISAVLTPEIRKTILKLKYAAPNDSSIPGIDYYIAVIRDGIRTWGEFEIWQKSNKTIGVTEWIP